MTEPALKGARGAAFTSFEDFLICKAFIASSEDPTVGTYQKGSTFQLTMHRIYSQFLHDHEKITSSLFEAVPSTGQNQMPSMYNRRTPKSIFDHFKNAISPRVMKFIAIRELTPRESGKNDHDFYEQCKILFSQQTTYGDFEPFKKCYEYLENKPKFASWWGNVATTVKKERPMGSKKAKEPEAVKEVAWKIIKEEKVDKHHCGNSGRNNNENINRMMTNLNSFIEMKLMRKLGNGLTSEEIADLDTPDRKAYRKARASFMIATMNNSGAKWCCLTFNEASCSVSSMSNSIPSEVHPKSASNSTGDNESDLDSMDNATNK